VRRAAKAARLISFVGVFAWREPIAGHAAFVLSTLSGRIFSKQKQRLSEFGNDVVAAF
jgi:hypothetical protein